MDLSVIESITEAPSIEDLKNLIVSVLGMDAAELPDDKQVEIEVSLMVVPKSVKFKIQKK